MGALAVGAWVSAVAPLLVLAVFVAPSTRWEEVLLPLQTISLLAAGTLLLTVSLGHMLAFLEAGEG